MSKASIETDMRDYGLSYPVSRQTNADRIRNMTDEELAELLCEYEACPLCLHQTDSMCNSKNCDEVGITLQWLQAEVKEGNSNVST